MLTGRPSRPRRQRPRTAADILRARTAIQGEGNTAFVAAAGNSPINFLRL